jgi:hypothetical protein
MTQTSSPPSTSSSTHRSGGVRRNIASDGQAALPPLQESSAGRKKGYKVLGDYDEFAEALSATIVPPPPPELDSVKNVDPLEFPEDVWNAASISPDYGAAIIQAYREVAQTR